MIIWKQQLVLETLIKTIDTVFFKFIILYFYLTMNNYCPSVLWTLPSFSTSPFTTLSYSTTQYQVHGPPLSVKSIDPACGLLSSN